MNLLRKINQRTTVASAAFLISGSYMASRLLGLLRDRLLASHFGVGPVVDAYTAAFRLPELLFTLLVSGAFAVAFIPVLSAHWAKEEREEAWEVASTMLNLLMVGTLVLGGLIFVFADPLIRLITPGFDPFRHDLAVDLTRIMMVTPFLFAISSVFGGIQQTFNRFLFYAMASLFYNVGIIFGIVFLSPQYSIYGVAYGVVLGTLLQAGVQLLGLAGLGYRYRPSFNLRHKSVRRVVRLMVPRSIDQGIDQLHYTVETVIGSRLATGSLTAYYYANNLKNVPLVIFGSAIATASFPRLAARAARKNREGLIEDFVNNARMILFLVIPAAIVAILMRGYIVRLLFGFGNAATANTLGWFAGTIVFQSLFFLVARMFYALQDTKTPLIASVLAIGFNILLSLWLSGIYGVVGLAMATSAAVTLETIALLLILRRRLSNVGERQIIRGVAKMLLAGVLMGSLVYIMVARLLPLYLADIGFMVVGPKFFAILGVAIMVYVVPCYAMGLREAHLFVGRLKEQMLKPLNLN